MDIEQRLAALEARVRKAEDHLEILNLLNTYRPLVDSGMGGPAGELWVAGGGYNFTLPDGGTRRPEAPAHRRVREDWRLPASLFGNPIAGTR